MCYYVYLSRLVDSLTKLNKKENLLKRYSGELSNTKEKPQNKFQRETLERFSSRNCSYIFSLHQCQNEQMPTINSILALFGSSIRVLEKKQQHSIDNTKVVVQLLKSTSWRKDHHSKMSHQDTC